MLRVKDPAISLDFYSRIMGMRVLRKLDFPEMKFSLYFLAVAELASSAPVQVVKERRGHFLKAVFWN